MKTAPVAPPTASDAYRAIRAEKMASVALARSASLAPMKVDAKASLETGLLGVDVR
jgi:hypothetical protein